ncbi:MAG: ABC transporter substrate-binding protein [Porphyromonadaceae bacterium]|nr:MAG: ABC transporter substrate-binding protein [Porphyromonadaceae bacterium]
MQRIPAVFLTLVLILSGCHSGQVKDKSVTLLTLKGPSAMGMIYLIDSPDQVIPEKLHVEILDEPVLVRARILKDKPELAVLPLNIGAILYNKDLPYQVIAIPVWGTLYLFGSDTSIHSWQSLKNKRIFLMGKGATPDILFRYLLKIHGFKPDRDVILDYSFPTHIDLANAVSAGQAELAVISEPLVSLARARNPSILQIMDLNAEWAKAFPGNPSMPQTALMGRKDFIRDHPDWIRKICEAWKRSIDRVNLHPEQAAGRIVFHNILPDPAIAVNSIPRCNLKFRYASEIRSEIGQYLQVFFTFNPDAVGGKLPDEQFICQKPDY